MGELTMGSADDRGQAYTIEGVIGAIVIASALVLGLQAVDIAPWTNDSTDRETEALRVQAQDVLAAAEDRDALRTAATCIAGDGDGTPHPAVAAGDVGSDNDRASLGILLNRTLDANDNRYTVYIDFPENGTINTTPITPERTATRPSVTVTRQIPLFDSDPVLAFDEDAGECVPAEDSDSLANESVYVANQNDTSDLYAVVRIRVVAW